jgi:type I restriction enzyme S subunit
MNKKICREIEPHLRFPEFRNSPMWRATKLNEVLTEHKLKSNGKCQVHSVSVHKGLVDQIAHLGRSYAAADTSNYSLVRPLDVVYTKSPTGDFPYGIVKQSQLECDAIVSPLYGVFAPKNRYIGQIIDAFFESPARANKYLEPIIKKGAKNTIQISNETFLSGEIFLPIDPREQSKVASFLSVQASLIAAQSEKINALKKYRRSLMQQLFPLPGSGS